MNVQQSLNVWARTTPVRTAANEDWYLMASAEAQSHASTPRQLLRLHAGIQASKDSDPPASAVDVMGAIEDLWVRLAVKGAIRVLDAGQERVTVSIEWPENCNGDATETRELMRVATSASTYRWKEGGRSGAIAEAVAWDGQTGYVDLAPWNAIMRGPEGEAVAWALQTLVARLRIGSQP